ncbi:hypothetical protein AXG93_4697s1310 [Marchantia polymorpha subsp. ruderalis]|uniref:Uncharacterized protein n=1 Tax=Marchantia polymorpha subsp. ruderalis TaxID=1480154 RepID=A0A176VNL4_MARPO|nr:hypothetical protein AXG93_4697s1310 [Marchantia polymorpha subsp. ruderalis]
MAQKAASRDHQRERERAIRSASSGLGASGSELGAPSAGRMSLAMAEKADPLPLRLRNELVGSGYGGQEGAGLTERESARESESESEVVSFASPAAETPFPPPTPPPPVRRAGPGPGLSTYGNGASSDDDGMAFGMGWGGAEVVDQRQPFVTGQMKEGGGGRELYVVQRR